MMTMTNIRVSQLFLNQMAYSKTLNRRKKANNNDKYNSPMKVPPKPYECGWGLLLLSVCGGLFLQAFIVRYKGGGRKYFVKFNVQENLRVSYTFAGTPTTPKRQSRMYIPVYRLHPHIFVYFCPSFSVQMPQTNRLSSYLYI